MPTKINFASSILTEYTYVLVGTFSCTKDDQRKARERELASFDENRRAVGTLNPMRVKNEGTYRGGKGTAPLTTACQEGR